MLIHIILGDAMRTLAGLLSGLALFRGIELAFPQQGVPRPQRNLLGLKIWIVYVAVQVALTAIVLAIIGSSGASPQVDPRQLLGLPTWAAAIVIGVAVILAKDFLFYWEHRIQHRWLWRWHAPHPAARRYRRTGRARRRPGRSAAPTCFHSAGRKR